MEERILFSQKTTIFVPVDNDSRIKPMSKDSLCADVYKRQVKMQNAERLLLEGKYNISEIAYKIGMNSTGSVSYTHLDVYKRQHISILIRISSTSRNSLITFRNGTNSFIQCGVVIIIIQIRVFIFLTVGIK